MKASHSRLLQVVIAAMLVNIAPDGRAETYDLGRVRAAYPDDYWYDADYFDAGYDNWDFNDYFEPSDSGDEEDDPPDELDPDKKKECDAIAAKVSGDCDLADPPPMLPNGCGSGVSTNLVPDYLMVNGVPMLRLGPIFLDACNEHDICYGTYFSNKEACDLSLNTNMISGARMQLTNRQWTYYESFVRLQALGYSAGLQAPFIAYLSGNAFSNAQLEGECRYYSDKAETAGCLD